MKLGDLIVDPQNPRQEFGIEDMQRLEQSIKTQGILNPLLVEKVKGGYLILDGERRYRVAGRLGMKVVPVRISLKSMTEKERLLVRFNLQEVHSPWTAWDKSVALGELQALTDWTASEMARQLGVSISTVTTLLALQRLSKRTISVAQKAKLPTMAVAKIGYVVRKMENDKAKAVEQAYISGVESGKISDNKSSNKFLTACRNASIIQLNKYATVKKYSADDVLKDSNSEHAVTQQSFIITATSTRSGAKKLAAILAANKKLVVKENTLRVAQTAIIALNRLVKAIGTRVEKSKEE